MRLSKGPHYYHSQEHLLGVCIPLIHYEELKASLPTREMQYCTNPARQSWRYICWIYCFIFSTMYRPIFGQLPYNSRTPKVSPPHFHALPRPTPPPYLFLPPSIVVSTARVVGAT